jgi:hypothetical protein
MDNHGEMQTSGSHHGKAESQKEGLPRRNDGHNECLLRSNRAHSREYED